ncbi:DNA-binding transcriptional regulator, MarR family [Kordiimonas lacus]|uniref:DNA-binding transcriptional regulator, MarR family n=2 Tax=Kordiimonas lacus TaxID=637679 RepID=A0A1G6TV60_9PROT|nr:DNA-binding transcriptional regulator, MarR family [Kordiimonas lacus]
MQLHILSILMQMHVSARNQGMFKEPSKQAQKAWISMMRASRSLLADIDQQLKRQGLPPLEWYDILWELERAGADTLRPQDLEQRTLLAQYQMSRVLGRMEAAGLITLAKMEQDKRGRTVTITAEGSRVRATMWECYGTFLRTRFDGALEPAQLSSLSDLMAQLRPDDRP